MTTPPPGADCGSDAELIARLERDIALADEAVTSAANMRGEMSEMMRARGRERAANLRAAVARLHEQEKEIADWRLRLATSCGKQMVLQDEIARLKDQSLPMPSACTVNQGEPTQ